MRWRVYCGAVKTGQDYCRKGCFSNAIRESLTVINGRGQGVPGWPCALLLLTANSAIASGAVVDDPVCVEATRFLERGECIDDRMAELNRLISEGYGKLVTKLGRPIANRIQIPFMRMRLMCGADFRCEYQWQISQLTALNQLEPAGRRELPVVAVSLLHPSLREHLKAGECALFRAAEVNCGVEEARSGECGLKPGGGSRNVLTEDLAGYAALDIRVYFRTRTGDPILACKGAPSATCKAGDAAGNSWTFTNYRTGVSWQIADAVRTCGGDSRKSGRN